MDNFEVHMKILRDKYQLKPLKTAMLLIKQEEFFLGEIFDTEFNFEEQNATHVRFSHEVRKLSKGVKKKVSALYIKTMNHQLSSALKMILNEVVDNRMEVHNKELEKDTHYLEETKERLENTPMAQEVFALMKEAEETNSDEFNEMERKIAIDIEKINVYSVEKEMLVAAYRPDFDRQVKELNALTAQLRELDEPSRSVHEAEEVVEGGPKRRLSGVQSQPIRTQEASLVEVQQQVVDEPSFVKMEFNDNELDFDIFNTSDDSDEPMPMYQPLQLVQARTDAAPQLVQARTEAAPQLVQARTEAAPQLVQARTEAAPQLVQARTEAAPQLVQARTEAAPQLVQARDDDVPQLMRARANAAAGTVQETQKLDPSPRKVSTIQMAPGPVQSRRSLNDTLPSPVPLQLAGDNNARDNPSHSNEANKAQNNSFVAPPVAVTNKRKEGPIGSTTPAKKPNYNTQQRRPPQNDFVLPSRCEADNWFERSAQFMNIQNAPKTVSSKPVASQAASTKGNESDTSMRSAGSRSNSSKSNVQSSNRSNHNDVSRFSTFSQIGSNDSILNRSNDSISSGSGFSKESRSKQAKARRDNDDGSIFSFDDGSFEGHEFQGDSFHSESLVIPEGDFSMGPEIDDPFAAANQNADDWSDFGDFQSNV